MAAEVKVTITTHDFQVLMVLLRYLSGKVDEAGLATVMESLGYRHAALVPGETLTTTVRFNAERLIRLLNS